MNNIPHRVVADGAQADAQLAELAKQLQTAPEPATITIPDPTAPPAAAAPPQDPTPPPQAPGAVPVDVTQQLSQLSHELASMRGRTEAERERNRVLEEEIRRLREQVAAPPAPAPAPVNLITEQDRSEFGAETVDFVERMIRQHTGDFGRQLTEISNRLAGLEGSVGRATTLATSVQQETLQQRTLRYEAVLDEKVPTWEVLQNNAKFLDWLDTRDVLSGRKYGDLLSDAHKSLDAGRVVALFRVFDPTAVKDSPASPAPSAQPTAPQPMVDPTSLAAPATSPAAAAPTQQPTGEQWTMSQVNELYERKRKGTISDADFNNLEQRYLSALAGGRVIVDQ
jgi:hypothetical protein